MKRAFLLTLILLIAALIAPVSAQETEEEITVSNVVISDINTDAFPDVVVSYRLLDDEGLLVEDIEPTVRENGTAVSDFEIEFPVTTGVEYIIVLDANVSMTAIDEEGGITRAAKTRTALADFMRDYVSEDGLDRVSLIVPEGDAPVVLADRVDEPQAAVEAVGQFNPTQFPNRAPIQEMLTLALERAAETTNEDRYQVIVLFTNGGFLGEQLNYDELINLAAQSQSEFYGVILGLRADANEIDNLAPLINAMGGGFTHMPQVADIARLGAITSSNSQQAQLTYRATVFDQSDYVVEIAADEVAAEKSYTVSIEPPQVELLIASKSIIRKGEDGTAADQLSPARVAVQSQVIWPDDRPRSLDSVTLTVNDAVQPIPRGALLDNEGLLTVDWDIASLKAGSYQLKMMVVDEFGLVGESQTVLVPITIQMSRATATVEPDPTATPVPSVIGEVAGVVQPWLTRDNLTRLLFIFIPLLAIILLWRYFRNRRANRANQHNTVTSPVIVDESRPLVQPAAVTMPSAIKTVDETADLPTPARLERFVPGTGEITAQLPLTKLTHIIGSDPFSADVVLDHGSVSRLHASIRYEHNRFLLYDEGSAYGTRLNFEQLGLSPRFLKEDDEISFGDVYVRFKLEVDEEDEDEGGENVDLETAVPASESLLAPTVDETVAESAADDEATAIEPKIPESKGENDDEGEA